MKQQQLTFVDPPDNTATRGGAPREDSRMDRSAYLSELKRLAEGLRKIHTPNRPLSDTQLIDALSKSITAVKSFDLTGLLAALEKEARDLSARIQSTIEQRRQNLLGAARAAGLPHKRFGEFDRIGPFKVTYRGEKVCLELGSELAWELEQTDGEKLFDAIRQRLRTLEEQQFVRDDFFRTLKIALRLARDDGHEKDGWVPVRPLHAYVVVARNLQSAAFLQKPTAKTFHDYSTAQFVYDLARFGKNGWSCGDETLRSQTPNMRTVVAGKTITLPSLDGLDVAGEQFAKLRIAKGATNGNDGRSGTTR